jgi:sigma-B regulation protein RsbU (phosphoserine phosphatase)
VRTLDLSGESSIAPLISMLQSMTAAPDPNAILGAFLAQYGRVRDIGAFVGLRPEGNGAYRVLYAVRTSDATDGHAAHSRDTSPAALLRLPVRTGGFLSDITRGRCPSMNFDLPVIDDPQAGPVVVGLTSCMALPIFEGDKITEWTLAFGNRTESDISAREVGQATMTANLLGAANRHAEVLMEVKRLNAALREQFDGIARVQQSLLPARIPDIPGLEISTSYLTSDAAGGDYYDFYPMPDGRWGIVIADVSGHGAAAATVMAMLHAIVHCYEPRDATQPVDPAAIMSFANRRLVAANLDGMFVTAFFAVYNPPAGELRYANWGHNPPRLKCGKSGEVIELASAATLPLGIMADAEESGSAVVSLEPKDTIILYTDGITEAFSPSREMFGVHRLDAALAHCTGQPGCVVDSIHSALYSHRGAPTRDDDQTIVAMRYHGVA